MLAGGLMIALAIPAFGMHTINPGVAGLPRSLPIMQTYDRIQEKFPGGPLPAVGRGRGRRRQPARGPGRHRRAAAGRPATTEGFGQPIITVTNPDKTLAVVDIPLAGDGTDAKSEAVARDAARPT